MSRYALVRGRCGALCAAAWFALVIPMGAEAQRSLQPQQITVVTGGSVIVEHPATLERISIANPSVVDALVVSAQEIVLNGLSPGTTTLLLWDRAGGRSAYTVEVTADAGTLQREFDRLFPGEGLNAKAVGNTLILSGAVSDRQVARRALDLTGSIAPGVSVIDNIVVPEKGQVLLEVRFAEVSRNALRDIGGKLFTFEDDNVATAVAPGSVIRPPTEIGGDATTVADAVNFFIFHKPSHVSAFIRILQQQGLFKSLAEPNLLAMPAETASFLAGGEFPFPVLQGVTGAVTIQFREFGIRLNFVPDITNSGAIRLRVAPEVSTLDFANGLQFGGFLVPALLSRRAETVVELQDGQTFAIAGLVDNTMSRAVTKIPILGDIPILGALFRSEELRQNRTELLVLVTPRLIGPSEAAIPVPTGEPETWGWQRWMRGKPPGHPEAGGH